MKNNKGFTLIELLVVIVILLGVTIIAIPNIDEAIKAKKAKELEDEKKMLINHAQTYALTNTELYNCIKNGGYLSLDTMATKKGIKLNQSEHGYAVYSGGEIIWQENSGQTSCDDKV